MAYYTALINAWNAGTVPSGVVGSALTGQTTAQKLININAWTVTATIPAAYMISGAQIANCINWAEFAALTAAQQSNVLALCNIPGSLLGGTGETALLPAGMVIASFPAGGQTIQNLVALSPGAQPWWAVSVASGGAGLTSPISQNDLVAAGGLT